MYALTTKYSFDSEVPVWLFATYEEACQELKRQFKKELKIQTEENGRIQGEDLETEYTDEWYYASITTLTTCVDEPKDVQEWRVSEIRTDAGIGNKIPIGIIADSICKNSLNDHECSSVFSALRAQDSFLGGKFWTTEDIKRCINNEWPNGITLTDDMLDAIASKVNAEQLDDATDSEWNSIKNGIRESGLVVHVSNIEWDDDGDDVELPKELDIPLSELEYVVELSDYICDEYGYCVKIYHVEIMEKKD